MYIFDTNVVSEMRKLRTGKANPGVIAFVNSLAASTTFLTATIVLELERGVLSVESRDVRQGAFLRKWLDQKIMPAFRDRVLPFDSAIARRCAHLHVPDRRPEGDAMIAATALVHNMIVVTRNVADFAPLQVRTLNPWSAQSTSA